MRTLFSWWRPVKAAKAPLIVHYLMEVNSGTAQPNRAMLEITRPPPSLQYFKYLQIVRAPRALPPPRGPLTITNLTQRASEIAAQGLLNANTVNTLLEEKQ